MIFIADLSRELDKEDEEIIKVIGSRKVICLLNKSDLDRRLDTDELRELLPEGIFIEGSVTEDQGIGELEETIRNLVMGGDVKQADSFVVTNVRHGALLKEAEKSLTDAIEMAETGEALELLEIDVNNAYRSLGLIIGEEAEDDIINEVFSRFCLGK